jgi:PRC-barrel domain
MIQSPIAIVSLLSSRDLPPCEHSQRAAERARRSDSLATMDDLGAPSSYLAVRKGAPVFSHDGEELGRVVEVLKDAKADMFDGVVFDTTRGPGGHRFVDAPEVGEIFERGVVLKLDAAEASRLRPPGENPGSIDVDPGEFPKAEPSFLQRAWNFLSGKGN